MVTMLLNNYNDHNCHMGLHIKFCLYMHATGTLLAVLRYAFVYIILVHTLSDVDVGRQLTLIPT